MAVDIIARGMMTEYKSGTNINFKENEDGSVTISASGDVSSEDTVARETIDNHKLDKNNPHNVTAKQVGLGNVNNTADLDKPISTSVQTALDDKANIEHTHKKSDITDFPDSLPADGGNADTVNNHTVGTDVPANAVFTDTVYDDTEIDNRVTNNTDNISQLFDITKGGETVTGNSAYSLENAVDYPLIGLNLYGKSTQNGTPTPENPVDIVSVGDSGFDIVTKNDTHFNLLSVRDNGGEIITKQPVSTAVKLGEKVTFTVAANGTGLTYQWQYSRDKGMTWNNGTGGGTGVTPAYSFNCGIHDNECNYKCIITDANGVKTETNIVTLYIVSDDCEITTASIATALPLCGIPVSSGGNYTDSNGQQWVCDELIYNADGSGKIKKYTNDIIFNGSEDWKLSGNGKRVYVSVEENLSPKFKSSTSNAYLFSNKYIAGSYNDTNNATKTCMATSADYNFHIYDERFIGDVAGLKADMAANNLIVVYALATPQEIELTAAEMTAFRQLQTFNGTTSISNSSGAEMSVKYCTNKALSEFVRPVTMGLQKQIDELRAAILSMGGNV